MVHTLNNVCGFDRHWKCCLYTELPIIKIACKKYFKNLHRAFQKCQIKMIMQLKQVSFSKELKTGGVAKA